LECYFENLPGSPADGHAFREWDELVYVGMPENGNRTIYCPDEYPHCITLHCQKHYGKFYAPAPLQQKGKNVPIIAGDKTVKSCGKFPGGTTTGEEACKYLRHDKVWCGHDPKFYCRYCDTDLCNKDA
jgi:hypothetical protein